MLDGCFIGDGAGLVALDTEIRFCHLFFVLQSRFLEQVFLQFCILFENC